MVNATPTFRVAPGGTLRGELQVPGDKSISHRALMFGGMAEGVTEISGFLEGEDCLATLKALQALGVRIERPGAQRVTVFGAGGRFSAPTVPLDMGNAGTAMRLFMGLLCSQPFDSTLIGDPSLSRRPMERVARPLRQMGARIDTRDGLPPVAIRGGARLQGIEYTLPLASAQLKSALLLAGLHAGGTTRITEPAVTRDHTERMLRAFGVEVERQGLTVSVRGGQPMRAAPVAVPGDFSSAAFFLVAGCLAADDGLLLHNVGMNPTRTGLIRMLQAMGAQIEIRTRDPHAAEPVADLLVRRSPLHGIRVPEEWVSLAIDEFPVFFIAAAAAAGTTEVSGAAELRVKESDRLAVMAGGLTRLGVRNELRADGIVIEGGAIGGGHIDSHGDHRIAMAFAVASLRATGVIEIGDVANVATSFPGFAGLARGVGLPVELLGVSIPVVTIDGPSGAGKGTVARLLAGRLGWHLLDSGALYRLVALGGELAGLGPEDETGHARLAQAMRVRFTAAADGGERVELDGQDVTQAIRTEAAGAGASRVARWPAVRAALLDRQRQFAQAPGLVADGRDMGSVIFPAAPLKVFLTASAPERAQRRHKQLKEKGVAVNLADLSREIELRDRQDATRSASPLRAADDAVHIDSTAHSAEDVVGLVWQLGTARGLWLPT